MVASSWTRWGVLASDDWPVWLVGWRTMQIRLGGEQDDACLYPFRPYNNSIQNGVAHTEYRSSHALWRSSHHQSQRYPIIHVKMRLSCARGALSLLTAAAVAHGLLTANQTDTYLLLANDRLTAAVNRSSGAVFYLTLDGQDLLGTEVTDVVTPGGATGNGVSGVGPYLDCYCTPEGSYTPGHDNATFTLHRGVDSRNVSYGGIVMSQVYAPTALLLEQYWFLRDGETGLHVFSRIANNHSNASAGVLQELRTLFRPNTDASIWTHLVVDDALWAPLPVPDPAAGNLTDAVTVQDATWDLGAPRGDADPYVAAFSEYFTKYVFSTTWRDQAVHGMYADGTRGADGDAAAAGSTFGSWLVMNTKDTYFGGPTWSDLTVDGIVYNYLVSNHHGNQAPNMTAGLDRTFGPFYYYFNRGSAAAAAAAEGEEGWRALRDDALRLADPAWSAAFYDDIAPLVPGYAPTSGRGGWRATVDVPAGAERPIAVLSASGWDFQDNAQDITAFQYWADVDVETGAVEIDRVRAGAYRLTVYANGIFGSHVQEGVVVEAGVTTEGGRIGWVPEAAGRELWRIGVP